MNLKETIEKNVMMFSHSKGVYTPLKEEEGKKVLTHMINNVKKKTTKCKVYGCKNEVCYISLNQNHP